MIAATVAVWLLAGLTYSFATRNSPTRKRRAETQTNTSNFELLG